MKIILLILLFNFFNLNFLVAKISNKQKFDILASINDKTITKYDINNYIKFKKFTEGEKFSTPEEEKDYKILLEEFLELYIKNSIATKSQEQKKTNDEIAWENLKKFLNTNLSLKEFSKINDIDQSVLIKCLSFNTNWYQYLSRDVKSSINVSNKDIDEYIEMSKNSNDLMNFKYNLSEIVIYYKDTAEKLETINKMQEIKKLSQKDNFIDLVKKFSQSNTAKQNGDIGWFEQKDLNEEFFNKIKDLKVNNTTNYICTEEISGMCTIFKLNKKILIKNNFGEEDREKIKNIIFAKKIEQNILELIDKERKKSDIKYFD